MFAANKHMSTLKLSEFYRVTRNIGKVLLKDLPRKSTTYIKKLLMGDDVLRKTDDRGRFDNRIKRGDELYWYTKYKESGIEYDTTVK